MKNLLQLDKKVISLKNLKKFMQLEWIDKILMFKVFALTAIMRSAILIIPFKKLRKYMGNLSEESTIHLSNNEYMTARRIAWSIMIISKYTPWESKCLVQALTAQYLLSRSNIESTLYLGVTKENNVISNKDERKIKLIAHSWIRCGSYYVTGGKGNGFKIVAKFSK